MAVIEERLAPGGGIRVRYRRSDFQREARWHTHTHTHTHTHVPGELRGVSCSCVCAIEDAVAEEAADAEAAEEAAEDEEEEEGAWARAGPAAIFKFLRCALDTIGEPKGMGA